MAVTLPNTREPTGMSKRRPCGSQVWENTGSVIITSAKPACAPLMRLVRTPGNKSPSQRSVQLCSFTRIGSVASGDDSLLFFASGCAGGTGSGVLVCGDSYFGELATAETCVKSTA